MKKIPFVYAGVDFCEAIVLACMDFRFWKETADFVENHLGIKSFDFPKFPGSAKAINEEKTREFALSCFEVACNLHKVEKIVLINHSDCGAYDGLSKFGGDKKAEKEFHFKELLKAKDILRGKFKDREILLFYANLSEDGEQIEFLEVE